MKCVLATDSFKGCLSSIEVERALAHELANIGTEVIQVPLSDGGEGMIDTFADVLHAQIIETEIHDPMMRRITACYGIADHQTAIIDTSQACGLTLLQPEERNPMAATTYGVGELVAHAVRRGCRHIIVGLGGSGTSDAGVGMLKALVDRLAKGKTIDEVLNGELHDCRFTLASDVRNPLCGPDGAAYIFARQKGATEEMLPLLDTRALRFAEKSARHFGYDQSKEPGAGAAGGLGYAFMQYLKAEVKSGADLLLELTAFDHLITDADLIITGEGRADHQTLMGKLPERVLRRSQLQQKPVWLIAGQVEDQAALTAAGFSKVSAITPTGQPLHEAIQPEVARKNIQQWVKNHAHFFLQ